MSIAIGAMILTSAAAAGEPPPAVNDVISRIADIQKSIDAVLEPIRGETITLSLMTQALKALSASSGEDAWRLANDRISDAEQALAKSSHPSPAAQAAVRDATALLVPLRDRSMNVETIRGRMAREVIVPLAAQHLRNVEALELLGDWIERTRTPVSQEVQASIHALARATELP